jgi:DNA-binding GntR family transcriptional regulator
MSLGVSRTPVREAIQKLSDEHLVDVKPRSGTRVAKVSHMHVYQAFMIRRALESETVFSAAKNLTQKNAKKLERNLKQHEMALKRKQYVDAISFDDEFHKTIADIANLPLLWRAITIFKAQLDRCRHQTLPKEGYGASTLAQHKAILDALKDRDECLARRMMQAHLDETYVGIQKFLDAHADAE